MHTIDREGMRSKCVVIGMYPINKIFHNKEFKVNTNAAKCI